MKTIDQHTIQDYLIQEIATHTGTPADRIDAHTPFADYGLDSITAITIAGDLEDWLGLQLPPALLWDYPIIAELAQHLAAATTGTDDASETAAPAESHPILDGMSDAEVDAMLNRLLAA